MLIFGKTVVAVAGTNGPLLGDGVNTTCTLLYPSALNRPSNSQGGYESIINIAAATERTSLQVARVRFWARDANTNPAFWGARGAATADMRKLAAGVGDEPLGNGDMSAPIDLGHIDVGVTTNGEAIMWVAELP